jgi:RHS repeat-associated protein
MGCKKITYRNFSILEVIPRKNATALKKNRINGDHLGNVRLSYSDGNLDGSIDLSEIIEESNYYPFGLQHKGYNSNVSSNGNSVAQKRKYNGKEFDESLGLNTYDFGGRNYNPSLGRWSIIDSKAELYFQWSPYNYVRNSPLMRIDPNGNWDITVHVANNRKKNGYGIAVVTDRHGKEVFRFRVRVQGIGGSDRTKRNADTPLGVYDIPNKNMWLSGGSRASYGPNSRLILTPKSGEILESGRTLIRIHGGRQEYYDKNTGEWRKVKNPKLKKTKGCLRCADNDILTLKSLVDGLMADDPDEYGGVLTLINDLEEFTSIRKDIEEILDELIKERGLSGKYARIMRFHLREDALIIYKERKKAKEKFYNLLIKQLENIPDKNDFIN